MLDPRTVASVLERVFELGAVNGELLLQVYSPGLDTLRADWRRGCLSATMFHYLESAGTRPVLPRPDTIAGSHFAWLDLQRN